MTIQRPVYKPLQGKSYSLFGSLENSDPFYELSKNLVDQCIMKYGDEPMVLRIFRHLSRYKNADRAEKNGMFRPEARSIKNLITSELSAYTRNTQRHLDNLGFVDKLSHTISTSEWQYHIYMLEVELTNRLNRDRFIQADYKIALLPHCLHDLTKTCKSAFNGVDYTCRKCSPDCYIRHATAILNDHQVEAYIWKSANLKSLLKKLHSQHQTLGVLGIACIPELVNGMRSCSRYKVPVVGLPLDGNRCIRWMGAFHPNSVNLTRLERLVGRQVE